MSGSSINNGFGRNVPPQDIPSERHAEDARSEQKAFVKNEGEKKAKTKLDAMTSVNALADKDQVSTVDLDRLSRNQPPPIVGVVEENEAAKLFAQLAVRLPPGVSSEIGLPFAADEVQDQALPIPMPAQPAALDIGRAAQASALIEVPPSAKATALKDTVAVFRGYSALVERFVTMDTPGVLDAHAALLAKLAPGQREALAAATGEIRLAYSAYQKADAAAGELTPIIPGPLMSRMEHAASTLGFEVDVDQLMFLVMMDATRTEEGMLRDKLKDMQGVNKQKKQLREVKTRMQQEQSRLEGQMHVEFDQLKATGELHPSITFDNYRAWRQCEWADVDEGLDPDGNHTASWPPQATQLEQPSPPRVPEWMHTGNVSPTSGGSDKSTAGKATCLSAGLSPKMAQALKAIFDKLGKEQKEATPTFDDYIATLGLTVPPASKDDILSNLKLVKDLIGVAKADAQKRRSAVDTLAITLSHKDEIVKLSEQIVVAQMIEKARAQRVQAGNYDMPPPRAPAPSSAELQAQLVERLKGPHAAEVTQAVVTGWMQEARDNVTSNLRRATDTMLAIARMQGRDIDEGFNRDLTNAMKTAYPPIDEGGSGVLAGAAAGAAAGSVFPGIGTLLGGAIGAAGAWLTGGGRKCEKVNIGFGAAGVQGNLEILTSGGVLGSNSLDKKNFGISNFAPLVPLMQALGAAGTSLTPGEMQALTTSVQNGTDVVPALSDKVVPAGGADKDLDGVGISGDSTLDTYVSQVDADMEAVEHERGSYWNYVHRKHFDGSEPEKKAPAEGGAALAAGGPALAHKGSLEELKAFAQTIDDKLQTLSDMSETDMVKLQATQDRRSKFLEALSNLLKKTAQTSDTITQNIK